MTAYRARGDTTKPGLWTMDWTVDWTMDWAFLCEMGCLAISWFAACSSWEDQYTHKGNLLPAIIDCATDIIMELVGN